MKYDIIFTGVGGQGVLSMAAIIGRAAIAQGLHAKQSEVHGMAQRGGQVQAHLRLSSEPIESDLIARGSADLILSLEPVEALRHVGHLAPAGTLVTAAGAFVNIPDYPDVDEVLARIRRLPRAVVVDAEQLAEACGDRQAVNTVMVGAASPALPLHVASLEAAIEANFARKGDRVVEINRAAFAAGRRAGS